MENKVRLLIDDGGGRLTRELEAPGGDLRAVCFSPDGRHVAAAGRGRVIHIWEAATGRQAMQIALPRGTVEALAYSPDGSLIASAGSGGQVQLWKAADGQSAGVLGKDLGLVMSLEFVGQRYVAAGTSNNLIHLWNLEDRNEHHRLLGHTGSVAALHYDSAAKVLISAGYDCTVRLWELGLQQVAGAAR
jgi:WD40 repeat protein